VDPPGIGEGISLAEPCVFVAFLRGVVLTDPVVPVAPVVPVVPDWQEVKNAILIRTAIREISCFFIGYTLHPTESGCLKPHELLGMLRIHTVYCPDFASTARRVRLSESFAV
jgi:hypothetical protein